MESMLDEPITAPGGALAAASERAGEFPADLLVLFAMAMGAVILLGVVVLVFRRRALNAEVRGQSGLAIDQIERLHQDGLLTEEEYRRARRAALGLAPPPAAEEPEQDGREDG